MKRITLQRGFSLTELAVVLVIVGLLIGTMLSSGTGAIDNRLRATTKAKLVAVEAALAGFVSVNGRLPCPADGSLLSSNASVGTENGGTGGCTAAQINGVVPWVALGITEAEASDAWDSRIMYRLGNYLWVARGMDMTDCDPAGSDATAVTPKVCLITCSASNLANCTPPNLFLQVNKGVTIKDATAGNTLMSSTTTPSGGAAYVRISHGKNAYGGFPFGGGSVRTTVGAGTDEATNANGVAVAFPADFFVDRDLNENTGASYFDDLVLRPSIMKVLQQAQRGPRVH